MSVEKLGSVRAYKKFDGDTDASKKATDGQIAGEIREKES